LTPEEQAWLAEKHTVRVRIADWPPYQIVKDNEPAQGIVMEYLKLIRDRTGITFKYEVTDQPFAEFLASMKQHQGPDMTAVIASTPERETYLSFSEPYIFSPYVIFIRGQDKPILDISGLTGKSLAVPRGFVVQEQLARDYADIRLALFDSDEEALQAVATGHSDAYIGNLTAASHIIHRRGFSSLQVTAAAPFKEQSLSMGNRKDWPELTSIINKALASITEEEKTAIRNKYLAIKYEQGIDKAEVLKWVLIVGGSTFGIVLVFVFWNRQMSREIRNRKQTEKDLKKAKDDAEAAQEAAEAANQAKSIFLANMSHELRTPLNAILGFSGMLAGERNATTAHQEKLAIINRSGQHLLSMINDVLDLSKIEAERIELQEHSFDLVAVIKEISVMIQSRAQEKGLSVAVESETVTFPYVKTDMGKLRQILINLLNNAVKFTDEGGVTIRCGSDAIPKEPNRCHIVIEVGDTGPGIDPARQAQIFEPFVRGIDEPVRKGTGLGLSICKKYAEFMGGAIELESEVGKGSLFRVRLPAEIAEAADVKTTVDDKPRVIGLAPTQKTWRILVADDNRENLLLLKSLLESVGFFVLEAENGLMAVTAFKKEHPDLVWMDMRMPVMDGYEAVRQIRQCPGGDTVPIIAITASAFREQRQEILAAGCSDMVIKPFQAHEIFEAMGRLLDIEYIYEPKSEAAPARVRKVELTAAMLADLPDELLQELREATLALNREAALEVIARIVDQAPEVAAGLKELVDNYQMGKLRDLLGMSGT
jgi:signal transduction histidine kinase/DNA-binding response OmpR family regulator